MRINEIDGWLVHAGKCLVNANCCSLSLSFLICEPGGNITSLGCPQKSFNKDLFSLSLWGKISITLK